MTPPDAHPAAVDNTFRRLADQLETAIRQWEEKGGEWTDPVFDDLARSAFELQFDGITAYRRYCEHRGATPAEVSRWEEIPAAPAAAFRRVPLFVGDASTAALTFLTSGTTAGLASRGWHFIRDPALYRASMEAAFRRLALGPGPIGPIAGTPDGGTPPDLYVSLVAPFDEGDGSSLAWMIDGLMERFGGSGSRHFASASGLDLLAATEFVASAGSQGRSVCIMTTTLALDEWLDYLRDHDSSLVLPQGSIVMDTGGAKGRDGLTRADVSSRATERLGLEPGQLINEFGMTELLSQLYSIPGDCLDETPWLRAPPWLRVRSLDPNDLSTLPDGEPGLLCYFDLANLGSVCAVLTEDIGRVQGGSVQWLRRHPGAPPRGCSLATAELLAAQDSATNG